MGYRYDNKNYISIRIFVIFLNVCNQTLHIVYEDQPIINILYLF